MKNINIDENIIGLIIDEFDGNLSDLGQIELQKWISSDPENEIAYREFHDIRNNLDLLGLNKSLDPQASWKTLEQRIIPAASDAKIVAISKTRIGIKTWALSAAALLICVLALFYSSLSPKQVTVTTLANEQKTYTLPDGSRIMLNANTMIQFAENNFSSNRKINLLKGEAFFEVVHDPKNVFQITVDDLRVTDLGTSFNIKREGAETTVIVSSGKVEFEHLAYGKKVVLNPGEKGTFHPGNKDITNASNLDVNYKSWIDKKLIFKNTPLSEVAEELEKTYGSRVTLNNNALENRTISATLNYQTIDSALVVISTSLQLKMHKEDKGYVLDNK